MRGQVAVSIVRGNSFVIFSRCLERREPFRATEPAHLENVPLGPAATNSVTRTCMALRLPHPSYPLSDNFFSPAAVLSLLDSPRNYPQKMFIYIYIYFYRIMFSVFLSLNEEGKKSLAKCRKSRRNSSRIIDRWTK